MINMTKWSRDFDEWSGRLHEALKARDALFHRNRDGRRWVFVEGVLDEDLRSLLAQGAAFRGLPEYDAWENENSLLIESVNWRDEFLYSQDPKIVAKRLAPDPSGALEPVPPNSEIQVRGGEPPDDSTVPSRPPFNAEFLLYLLLKEDEREVVLGDLIEGYFQVLRRFNKRRADIWFYKQVIGSLLPFVHRAIFRIGAFVWLGRVLGRLVS